MCLQTTTGLIDRLFAMSEGEIFGLVVLAIYGGIFVYGLLVAPTIERIFDYLRRPDCPKCLKRRAGKTTHKVDHPSKGIVKITSTTTCINCGYIIDTRENQAALTKQKRRGTRSSTKSSNIKATRTEISRVAPPKTEVPETEIPRAERAKVSREQIEAAIKPKNEARPKLVVSLGKKSDVPTNEQRSDTAVNRTPVIRDDFPTKSPERTILTTTSPDKTSSTNTSPDRTNSTNTQNGRATNVPPLPAPPVLKVPPVRQPIVLSDLVDEKNAWKRELEIVKRESLPETEIAFLHKQIQREMTYCLLTAEILGRSVYNEFLNIDILVEDVGHFTLIEIKTGRNVMTNIREAIGQLLEYQYVGKTELQKKMNRLLIVSPAAPTEEARNYVNHLCAWYGIRLSYKEYLPGSFSFSVDPPMP
jgi:hypothetical protein